MPEDKSLDESMEDSMEESMAEEKVLAEEDGEGLPAEAPEEEARQRPDEDIVAALEALLFTTGEAVGEDRLMTALKIDRETFERCMGEVMDRFETDDHGIHVIRLDKAYQMCTKTSYYDDLIALEVAPKKPTLTDVVLETLSIIAYKQPVTKAEIEKIRGVNSDHAVNKLVEFKLVKELGRLNAPGRPILFGTTEEFLRSFGVSSADELPEIDAVRIEDFKAEAEEEASGAVGV